MDLRAVLLNLNDENVAKLYKEYKQPLFLFILSITKDYSLSEDIIEEVFMRIIRYHATYKPFKNPKTWIYTIARNTTYTFLKRKTEVSIEDTKLEFLINQYNTVQNPDFLLVEEYLSCLNDRDRTIVFLHVCNDLTHLQISKILKMSHTRVRSRYCNAIKKLKEKMKDEK